MGAQNFNGEIVVQEMVDERLAEARSQRKPQGC